MLTCSSFAPRLRRTASLLIFFAPLPALCQAAGTASAATPAAASTTSAAGVLSAGVLSAASAGKLLPASVFFRGQSAPIQARNSGGVQFPKDGMMLAALVDTSGYSTSVQEKYQSYFITETPLLIDGHRLAPGAYGVGFIAGDQFIVMDLGAHDLFTAHTTKDPVLRRPSPLQILADPGDPGRYRLYSGRTFVLFSQAAR